YATAHHWYAMYLSAIGRQQEAFVEIEKARELNPLSLIINDNLGWIFYFGGQYDRAIEQYQKTLELDPNFVLSNRKLREAYAQKSMLREALAGFQEIIDSNGAGLALVGYVYGKLGKRAEAQKVVNELEELSRQRYISGHYMAQVYLGLGE